MMYLAQDVCGLKLREIADHMVLKRAGGIPPTIGKLKSRMECDQDLFHVVKTIKRQNDTWPLFFILSDRLLAHIAHQIPLSVQ